MASDFYFWIEATIGIFLGILMYLDYKKFKEAIFKIFALVFALLAVKSLFYIGMHFTQIRFVNQAEGSVGVTKKILDSSYLSLYNLRYFSWQFIETLFMLMFAYLFINHKKSAERKKSASIKALFIIQAVVLIAFGGGVILFSLLTRVKPSYASSVAVVELLKGSLGRSIFIIWRLALIAALWINVASIYGYLSDVLVYITKSKRHFFILLGSLGVLTLFSLGVPVYRFYNWLILDVLAAFFIALIAYRAHTIYVQNLEGDIVNLEKERDIIIQLMRDISAVIGSGSFDKDTVVKQIVQSSLSGTHARGAAFFLKDASGKFLKANFVEGMYPPQKPLHLVQGMAVNEKLIIEKVKSEKIEIGEGLLGQIPETGESIYIPDARNSKRYKQIIPDFISVSSFIGVPIQNQGEVYGVLSIVDDTRNFVFADVSLLETLGEQAAITLKQIEMYTEVLEKKQAEKELGVAGEIQSSLVPHVFPEASKYEIFAFSIPAKGVGGDYYDYIDFGNNKLAVTMFDVSGKGVPASLIMVMIRSILRTIASLEEETKDILTKLNDTISEDIVEDRYATGFYLLFDAEKGIMSYTNAGHGPLILYRAHKDEFEFLDTDGMPVGIMPGVAYGQDFTTLDPGDVALLYTDGITEAMNLAHEEFGMERFYQVVRENAKGTAKDIADSMLAHVNEFVGTAPQHDDETLLVLKMK